MTNAEKRMSEADRAEWEKLLADTAALNASTTEQAQALTAELYHRDRSGQAWAGWLLQSFAHSGARERLKSWTKNQTQLAVSFDGQVVLKPRYTSVRQQDGSSQMKLFEFLSWDELRQKREEARLQGRKATETVSLCDRLLDLETDASSTPHAALVHQGLTIEEYLAS